MDFKIGQVIADRNGENRWKIVGMIQKKRHYALHKVEDQAPGMRRELFLMTLDYGSLPGKNRALEIDDLRHSFYRMAEILCANYTFLPEPVDLIRFDGADAAMSADQRNNEPGLVFAQPEGFRLPGLAHEKKPEKKWMKIKSTVRSCARTLDALHRNQVVIRALPIHSIYLCRATYKPYFFGFDTLIRMDDFKGHNPNRACLSPEPLHAAPECFDSRGYLSPAADIYALGKLVLQVILPQRRYDKIFKAADPFPADIQNRINDMNLPPLWARFLSLCLHPSPKQRFQSAFEVEKYFLSDGKPSERPEPEKRKTDEKRKPDEKRGSFPWRYRPNPRLPPAALAIWWPNLGNSSEQFDFMGLYHKFIYQYRYEPRLFFNASQKPLSGDNPFGKLLTEKFGLRVVDLPENSPAEQVKGFFDHLVPESLTSLILVGNADQTAVKELFRHPKAGSWNIIWIRSGEGHAPIPVSHLIEASEFFRKRKKRGSQ